MMDNCNTNYVANGWALVRQLRFTGALAQSKCFEGTFFRPSLIALGIVAVLCGATSRRLLAQRMDSFDGGDPRWILVESDCGAQLTRHELSLHAPHGGRTSEMVEISCSSGQEVLLAYPIEPNAILNEFQPQVWIRCASGRVRLGVRVVFPNAEHPVSGGRLTTILWGQQYSETGNWQKLQVLEMERLQQIEIIAIRQQLGNYSQSDSSLNLEGAYIDSLVLNAYTGPGRYRVQIDDLDLRGLIPLASIGIPLPKDWREKWRWRHLVPSAESKFWAKPNQPPVWLQYRGENLPWIQSLGFTGVMLNSLPSQRQLEMIRQASLSALSPPPEQPVVFKPEDLMAIKGWMVGAALDGNQSDAIRQQVQRVASFPEELKRPTVGEALEQFWLFSRIADEVIVPTPDLVSAGTLSEKQDWLRENLNQIQLRGNGWVSIYVDLNPAVSEQIQTARKVLGDEDDSLPIHPCGVRQEFASALIAGARGVVFRTDRPLDMQSTTDTTQVAVLRWCNNDLRLWGPWITAGRHSTPPSLDRSDYSAAAWSVNDSQLVIAQSIGRQTQSESTLARENALKLRFSPGGEAPQIIRLTDGTVELMQIEASPAGLSWSVEQPRSLESFVVTRNPMVLSYLRNRLQSQATENASDQLEIASYCLGQAAEVLGARFPAADLSPETRAGRRIHMQQLSEIQQQLDRGWQALRTRQVQAATKLAFESLERSQQLLDESYAVANSNLATPQASPFVLTPGALKYHWLLADACRRSQWQQLDLPGGQFANLGIMQQYGWSQKRRLEDKVNLRVELVPATTTMEGGLRLAAYAKGSAASGSEALPQIPGGYEGTSLWVRSAGAPVKARQLIRISAMAHVLRSSADPTSGLLVYDNQAGPSLGQLVRGPVGTRVPIELYRFVVNDGEFRVLAECRGEADIVLEAIEASVIDPATNRQSYNTSSFDSIPTTIVGDAYLPPSQ